MTTSHLEKEILQQPTVIRNFLARQSANIATISDQVRSKYKFVVIAARGTSDNAARYAQYLFGAHNRLQVALATPSLFTFYNTHPDLSDALVIGISQSGRSPDIISVIEAGRKCGSITLAITNDPASPLALSSDYHHSAGNRGGKSSGGNENLFNFTCCHGDVFLNAVW